MSFICIHKLSLAMKRILLLFTILLFATNINAQSSSKVSTQKTVNQKEFIEVFVNAKGKIFVNGKKVKPVELEKQFAALQEKNGVVHYFKSKIEKKSVIKQNKYIMELLKKYKRPVTFYTDKNFTTAIIW